MHHDTYAVTLRLLTFVKTKGFFLVTCRAPYRVALTACTAPLENLAEVRLDFLHTLINHTYDDIITWVCVARWARTTVLVPPLNLGYAWACYFVEESGFLCTGVCLFMHMYTCVWASIYVCKLFSCV